MTATTAASTDSTTTVRTTATELLALPPADSPNLSLWRAPLHLQARRAVDGATDYLAIVDEPLGRRGLMDLLCAVAPMNTYGPDDFGEVLDDWYLPERAERDRGASTKLLIDHARALRGHWREFARHREAFVAVMADRHSRRFLLPVLRWRRDVSGARRWRFEPLDAAPPALAGGVAGRATGYSETGLPLAEPVVGLLTVPYFLPRLTRGWPKQRSLTPQGRGNFMGPAQVPVLALVHRRALLNSAFVGAAESALAASLA